LVILVGWITVVLPILAGILVAISLPALMAAASIAAPLAAAVLLGLMLILSGQVARAVFDIADARTGA
jgi:hypothetical protein